MSCEIPRPSVGIPIVLAPDDNPVMRVTVEVVPTVKLPARLTGACVLLCDLAAVGPREETAAVVVVVVARRKVRSSILEVEVAPPPG